MKELSRISSVVSDIAEAAAQADTNKFAERLGKVMHGSAAARALVVVFWCTIVDRIMVVEEYRACDASSLLSRR